MVFNICFLYQLDMNKAISLKTFLQETNELTCPICMDTIIAANTTICGHTFCEQCLLETLLLNTVISFLIFDNLLRFAFFGFCSFLKLFLNKFLIFCKGLSFVQNTIEDFSIDVFQGFRSNN